MVSTGEKERFRAVKEVDEGVWRLRSFDRSFLLILCGIIVGMVGDHGKPSFALLNESCRDPSRCDATVVLADILHACRSSTQAPITLACPPRLLGANLHSYAEMKLPDG